MQHLSGNLSVRPLLPGAAAGPPDRSNLCFLTIRLCAEKGPQGQQHGDRRILFLSRAIKVFTVLVVHGLTILVYSSRILTSLEMSHQGPWHLVEETVISPLHGNSEVNPDDSISQVDSGHSKASSSSSRRRREAKVKAAVASLQARQLAERVKRGNKIREQEFQEEMAQRELECRKRELNLL